jgi:hypothetical protein
MTTDRYTMHPPLQRPQMDTAGIAGEELETGVSGAHRGKFFILFFFLFLLY